MKARYFTLAASVLLFAACGGTAENTEEPAVDATAPIETTVPDTTMAPMPMDTGMTMPETTDTGLVTDTAAPVTP